MQPAFKCWSNETYSDFVTETDDWGSINKMTLEGLEKREYVTVGVGGEGGVEGV